jgi:hypothetical protein
LLGFPAKDPLFLDRVLMVDADTTIPADAAARGNAVKLPCVAGAGGTARSFENTIKQFLKDISAADGGALHAALLNLNITNSTSDRVHATFFEDSAGASTKRDSAKKWWRKNWYKLKKWKVIEGWADVYKTEVKAFESEFERALARTVSRATKSS